MLHLTLPPTLTHVQAMGCMAAFLGELKLARNDPLEGVVLDASPLRHFDSSALGLLLGLKREVNALGLQLIVQSSPDELVSLSKVYGVAQFLAL